MQETVKDIIIVVLLVLSLGISGFGYVTGKTRDDTIEQQRQTIEQLKFDLTDATRQLSIASDLGDTLSGQLDSAIVIAGLSDSILGQLSYTMGQTGGAIREIAD
jgi:hypothetical protein